MHNLFIVLSLFLLIIMPPGIARATIQVAVLEDPVLEFKMQSEKEVYKPGETIKLTFNFRNKSEADVNFCTFDLAHRLKESLVFRTAGNEAVFYKLVDWTKRNLRIHRPEDFILLKPGGEYQFDLIVETSFPTEETWRYIENPESATWGQGLRDLPAGQYQVETTYTNYADGYQELFQDGQYTRARDIPVRNVWIGNLASNEVNIRLVPSAEKPEFTGVQPTGENIFIEIDDFWEFTQRIKKDMTPDEVIAVLGQPKKIIDGDWFYTYEFPQKSGQERWSCLIVHFEDGKVVFAAWMPQGAAGHERNQP